MGFVLRFIVLGVFCLIPGRVEAHGKGMYASQSEAAARAKELNCSGTHENDGKWMPCQDEADLHRALRRQ